MKVVFTLTYLLLAASRRSSSASVVPGCTWFAYDPNIPVAGYCTTNDAYYTAVPATPTTFVAKQLTRVFGRQALCNAAKSEGACKGLTASLGCYWNEKQCDARERSDWNWFSRHVYLEEAPKWLMCPGSPIALWNACTSIANGQDAKCEATAGCAIQKSSTGQGSSCTTAFMLKMTESEQKTWFDKYRALDPLVVGSCKSACYLKGIFKCAGYNSLSAAESACRTNPSCNWSSTDQYCSANLVGADVWGQAVAQAMLVCSGLSKDKYTCSGGSPNAAAQPARIQQYKDYVQAASSYSCPY